MENQLIRNALSWLEKYGYRAWSNGCFNYWVFEPASTDLPGDMGRYVGYTNPIGLLCLAADLRDHELSSQTWICQWCGMELPCTYPYCDCGGQAG